MGFNSGFKGLIEGNLHKHNRQKKNCNFHSTLNRFQTTDEVGWFLETGRVTAGRNSWSHRILFLQSASVTYMQSVLTHYCISATRIAKVRLPQHASFGAFATEVAMYVHLLPFPCLSARMSIWRTAHGYVCEIWYCRVSLKFVDMLQFALQQETLHLTQ